MASGAGNESTNDSSSSKEAERPPIEPIRLPTIEEIRGQDIWNNCAVRSVVSGVMGTSKAPFSPLLLQISVQRFEFSFRNFVFRFPWLRRKCRKSRPLGGGLGLFMGMFLGALDNPLMQEEMKAKQQFIYTAKQMGRRSWSSAKTFAVMGLIFSAAECVVEKVRAKHDVTNTVVAGCATGGVLSAKGGPKAACAGCAGFAAFSVVIEKFLDRHD
ncbi:Mitochondrial import inner membrane translocase subunit TIM22-1 [Morella rubra]|uniref:Mitochondrial import inner membrane translocase subunit TIM22-1 n=1 Tax=Morella rubra TaxID=262757 RepID=A0A6A1UPQ9_9ROSI|nr:Mitochondrial import inner membrane translocase subunit TIM22-1 [Morella rubra]